MTNGRQRLRKVSAARKAKRLIQRWTRLTDAEDARLVAASERLGCSPSDVLRRGLATMTSEDEPT